MNKKIYLQFIASFLIVLMLNFPFYTTSVFATIHSISAKGSDGFDGFLRGEDFMDITVTASVSGEPTALAPDQVLYGGNPGIKFTQCKPSIISGSDCTLRVPGNDKASFPKIPFQFTINLFKKNGDHENTRSSDTIIVDNRKPQITLGIGKNKFSSGESADITYGVTDFSCSHSSCENKCVGIKSIEFSTKSDFTASGGPFSQPIDPDTDECTVEDTIQVDLATFGDGLNSIFARATDNFDQVSAVQSVTFDLDTAGPSVLVDTFTIEKQGFTLSTFSDNKVNVDIKVDVSEKERGPVTADLSELNPSDNSLRDKEATCTKVDVDLHTCIWPITYGPSSVGAKNIIVTAKDLAGNEVSTTINKQLTKDADGPVVKSLVTDNAIDGQSYGRPSGNTVTAVLDETTGLVKEDVILHIGGDSIPANECTKETDWTCTWSNVRFGSSDTVAMSINSDTTDILLNPVSAEKTVDVSIDTDAPLLKGSISIIPFGAGSIPGFFKIGDRIAVEANLTDDSQVSAKADFSNLIEDASEVDSAPCDFDADKNHYKCVWRTDRIDQAVSGKMTFTFTDVAGNLHVVEKEIDLFGLDESEVPDLWDHPPLECSPKTLDREISSLIQQRVYCEVKLEKKNSRDRISTVHISKPVCTDPDSIIDDDETTILNAEAGSTSPIIKLTLRDDADIRLDESNIECSIEIKSKNEETNKITKSAEIENVEIDIEFYNLPLGELGDGVKEKIRDAKKSARDIDKVTGFLNEIITVSTRICQLLNTLYLAVSGFYIAHTIIKGEALACYGTVVGALGACQTIDRIGSQMCLQGTETASNEADTAKAKLNKFCDFVTCRTSLPYGDDLEKWWNDVWFQGYVGTGDPQVDIARDTTIGRYMNPQDSVVVALAFGCIPGMINGAEKFRQIQCLYADCLENAVGREGLAITECENLKHYETCKYIWTEAFAVVPWTAFFDHFSGLARGALSDPFSTLGIPISKFCTASCNSPDGGIKYTVCKGARIITLLGDAAENFGYAKDAIDQGFGKVRQDSCANLDFSDLEDEEEAEEAEENP